MITCKTHKVLVGCEGRFEERWFYKHNTGKRYARCRICCAIIYARYQNKPVDIDKIIARQTTILDRETLKKKGMRRCTICKIAKRLSGFYKPKEGTAARGGAIHCYCKICCDKHLSSWRVAGGDISTRLRMKRDRLADPVKVWATLSTAAHKKRYAQWTMPWQSIANLCRSGVGNCAYCGHLVVVGYNATVDIKDKSAPINEKNLCLACQPCNSSKKTKTVREHLKSLTHQEYLKTRIVSNIELLRAYYASFLDVNELIDMACLKGAIDCR